MTEVHPIVSLIEFLRTIEHSFERAQELEAAATMHEGILRLKILWTACHEVRRIYMSDEPSQAILEVIEEAIGREPTGKGSET